MPFPGRLDDDLEALGLGGWQRPVADLVRERLAPGAHGDMPRWRAALEALPEPDTREARLDGDVVVAGSLCDPDREVARALLAELKPWRKGPFRLGGIAIDSEWRSNLKWDRLAARCDFAGRRVLDVGCGNGYYALRAAGAGASCVVGVDPTLLYVMQFAAVRHFLDPLPVHVLPLRSAELPAAGAAFDTVMSMGVLYHQRSPLEHLRELRGHLRPGGQLILETLVLPGDEPFARTPPGRYARMRNVWLLPTLAELGTWLARSGYREASVADVTATTVDEQRTTEWMPFESLAEALDPADPSRTVEGWPAPRRAILVAVRPGGGKLDRSTASS